MTNFYVPNSDLAYIIGDGGLSRPSPAPTKVAGDKVNACLELQSTTRADIFLKPKTDAQINAIPNPTAGMLAFSSDSGAIVVRGASAWTPLVPAVPPPPFTVLYQSIDLTTSQIQDEMAAGTIQILPAPGSGLTYVVHGLRFSLYYGGALYTGGGSMAAYFSVNTPDDHYATNFIPATFLTTEAFSKAFYVTGYDADNSALSITENTPLIFASEVDFAGGGTSTGKVQIWYSTVPI